MFRLRVLENIRDCYPPGHALEPARKPPSVATGLYLAEKGCCMHCLKGGHTDEECRLATTLRGREMTYAFNAASHFVLHCVTLATGIVDEEIVWPRYDPVSAVYDPLPNRREMGEREGRHQVAG